MNAIRSIFLTVLFGLLIFGGCSALGAPGEVKTNSVTLKWDLGDPTEYITHQTLYYRTNFPPGMPQTNSPVGEVMTWIPPDDQSGWQVHTVITNLASDGTLLNVTNVTVDLIDQAMFFVVTGSNERGESPFSNVAWLSGIPLANKGLRIEALD